MRARNVSMSSSLRPLEQQPRADHCLAVAFLRADLGDARRDAAL
jgi:hypothetical protein